MAIMTIQPLVNSVGLTSDSISKLFLVDDEVTMVCLHPVVVLQRGIRGAMAPRNFPAFPKFLRKVLKFEL